MSTRSRRARVAASSWPASVCPGRESRFVVRLQQQTHHLPDEFVRPDRQPQGPQGSMVWLDRSRVRVDVDEFLDRADIALGAYRSGEPDAQGLLMVALAAPAGSSS